MLWFRIALIAASSFLMGQFGVDIYDPVTETITIKVVHIEAVFGFFGGLGAWKALHSWAKRTGGAT